MDALTFKEKLADEEFKAIEPTKKMIQFLDGKYAEREIIGAFRINKNFSAIFFKQKLWDKLAFFKDDEWHETRVCSLKKELPEAIQKAFLKKFKKAHTVIKIETVISEADGFYYYLIVKVSGKKRMLHVNKEGEVILNEKYIENHIRLESEDDEEDDDEEEIEDIEVSAEEME